MWTIGEVLNYDVGSLLVSYLGLQLDATNKDIAVRDPVILRTEQMLKNMRQIYLAKGLGDKDRRVYFPVYRCHK